MNAPQILHLLPLALQTIITTASFPSVLQPFDSTSFSFFYFLFTTSSKKIKHRAQRRSKRRKSSLSPSASWRRLENRGSPAERGLATLSVAPLPFRNFNKGGMRSPVVSRSQRDYYWG